MHAQRDDRSFRISAPAFTCPQCGAGSPRLEDARQGYCAACREFTGGPVYASAGAMFAGLEGAPPGAFSVTREPTGDWQCPECGVSFRVPPGHAGTVLCADCGRPGHPVCMAQLERVTVDLAENPEAPWECEADFSRRFFPVDHGENFPAVITGAAGEESPERQQEVDDYPWFNPMRWRPGDAEL